MKTRLTRLGAASVVPTVADADGNYHLVESKVRGYGTRDFPRFEDTVAGDPIDLPVEERIIDELAVLLRENEVSGAAPR